MVASEPAPHVSRWAKGTGGGAVEAGWFKAGAGPEKFGVQRRYSTGGFPRMPDAKASRLRGGQDALFPVGLHGWRLLFERGSAYVAPMNPVSPWNEFRVGWKPLASAVIGKAFSFGTIPIYVVGVFTVPLGEAFGWSRAEVTFSFTVATFTSASLSPLVGWLCDRFGSRPLVVAGTVGYGLGMAIIATSSDWLLRYYASWSLATMLGVGASAIALTRFVAGWFELKRGLALGIMLMGSGLTAFAAPPFVASLIENFDWRAGYLGLSAAILLIGVPVVVAGMKDAPKKTAPANNAGADDASSGDFCRGGKGARLLRVDRARAARRGRRALPRTIAARLHTAASLPDDRRFAGRRFSTRAGDRLLGRRSATR